MTYQLHMDDLQSIRTLLDRIGSAEDASGVCLDLASPLMLFIEGEPIGYLVRAEDGLAWQASPHPV